MTALAMRRCVCGATTEIRLYPAGWRCSQHTPAALAGEPEPDEIRDRHRKIQAELTAQAA